MIKILQWTSVLLILLLGSGCAVNGNGQQNLITSGVGDFQVGSVVEKNIFIDSSQFRNKSIKVVTRNMSGDPAYRLDWFSGELNSSFARKGYVPTQLDSFGIKIDINVLYSGRVQRSLANEYAFLGSAAGGIIGYRSNVSAGTATGMLVGATIGSLMGSSIIDETYVIVAEVSLGVSNSLGDGDGGGKKVITFGSSPNLQEENIARNFIPFREVLRTKIAVYAGGRNVAPSQVEEIVRNRLIYIISEII